MQGLVNRIVPCPRVKLASTAGNVDAVVRRTKDSTWIVLINHGGEEHFGSGRPWTRMLPPCPAYEITVEVRDKRMPLQVNLNSKPCRYDRTEYGMRIPLVMDSLWKVIRLIWE